MAGAPAGRGAAWRRQEQPARGRPRHRGPGHLEPIRRQTALHQRQSDRPGPDPSASAGASASPTILTRAPWAFASPRRRSRRALRVRRQRRRTGSRRRSIPAPMAAIVAARASIATRPSATSICAVPGAGFAWGFAGTLAARGPDPRRLRRRRPGRSRRRRAAGLIGAGGGGDACGALRRGRGARVASRLGRCGCHDRRNDRAPPGRCVTGIASAPGCDPRPARRAPRLPAAPHRPDRRACPRRNEPRSSSS